MDPRITPDDASAAVPLRRTRPLSPAFAAKGRLLVSVMDERQQLPRLDERDDSMSEERWCHQARVREEGKEKHRSPADIINVIPRWTKHREREREAHT